MNKKMIMGAVCAMACATNFAFLQPASAGFLGFGNSGIMSASEQENWARHLNKEEFGTEEPEMYSEEAKEILPVVRGTQRRVCSANGIAIVTNKFTDKYDYKDKVHPVGLVDNFIDATTMGAGYFYIGVEGLRARNLLSFSNQYDYMALEQTIAHELFHCTDGHTLYKGKEREKEVWAEEGSIKYTDNLPEGGWGVFLVAHNNNDAYPEIAKNIRRSFEKQTGNKVSIDSAADVMYKGPDDIYYPIVEEKRSAGLAANAYFGGQMANCMSKGALSLNNIRIVRNHLKNEINYKGDFLLVCESSNLPNGYRILTELYGDEATLQKKLGIAKNIVRSGDLALTPSAYKTARSAWMYKDNSVWKIWLACAIAYDFETSRTRNMLK